MFHINKYWIILATQFLRKSEILLQMLSFQCSLAPTPTEWFTGQGSLVLHSIHLCKLQHLRWPKSIAKRWRFWALRMSTFSCIKPGNITRISLQHPKKCLCLHLRTSMHCGFNCEKTLRCSLQHKLLLHRHQKILNILKHIHIIDILKQLQTATVSKLSRSGIAPWASCHPWDLQCNKLTHQYIECCKFRFLSLYVHLFL